MDSMRLMGIDIGAGSLKTMIVSADGAVQGSASATLHTRSPHPGWSEQDPAEWWQAVCDTVPRALAEAGRGTVKLATAAAMSIVTERPRPDPTVINYPFCVPGYWYTIGATNSCASAHRWLRDCFFGDAPQAGGQAFDEMDRQAAGAPPGSGGLLFHPYLQGERTPHWDPLLRGDFIGMTFAHDRRHFVRALYEGIAFSLRDVLGALRSQGLDMSQARIIGGGSRSATWRQIVTDVLGLSIVMPRVTDASFGAALIAGVGIGMFPDEVTAVERTVSVVASHEPDPAVRGLYEDLYGIYRDSALQLVDINHRLSSLGRT